jgi:hypothetical protein
MSRCYECAVCTERPELNLGAGRTAREVEGLAAPCSECRHRFARHMHGHLRRHGWVVREELFPVGRPPRRSPLGRLLADLGKYDDYFALISRTRGYASAPTAEPIPLRARS